MYNKDVQKTIKRLQQARLCLMRDQPFYAVLLLHMQFALDPGCETAYTDGERIAFCPEFIDRLTDKELEFVLMHEVLHVALNHCGRTLSDYDFDRFNTACDIVVNSNILYSCDMDLSAITLEEFGVSMHLTPDGEEGYEYTAEEVYKMLDKKKDRQEAWIPKIAGRGDEGFDDHTYWPEPEEAGNTAGDDQDETWEGGADDDGRGSGGDGIGRDGGGDGVGRWDIWLQRMAEATQIVRQIRERKGASESCGKVPAGAERLIRELTKPQTDWRTVLDNFIQEEINDYSFAPPDRRFQDSPFLLPDYNEKEVTVGDILFMVDTSGSMSDQMIRQAYSEICGAIRQFGGRLKGWLGFFDASVTEPLEFTSEEELKIIRAFGGGGTSFHCIFQYVREHREQIEPVSIVILTDGYAPFPEEEAAMGIPVLWLINNDEVVPPWGRVTRIRIEEEN